MGNYQEKLDKANKLLEDIKTEILQEITIFESFQYCSNRLALPWLEEECVYEIKKLQLNKKDEEKYIMAIHRIFGVYSEDQPQLKRKPEK